MEIIENRLADAEEKRLWVKEHYGNMATDSKTVADALILVIQEIREIKQREKALANGYCWACHNAIVFKEKWDE